MMKIVAAILFGKIMIKEDVFVTILRELSKYTFRYVAKFAKLYNITDKKICISISNMFADDKRHLMSSMSRRKQVSSQVRECSGKWDSSSYRPAWYRVNIYCSSINDFWNRWNKFKKLNAFL